MSSTKHSHYRHPCCGGLDCRFSSVHPVVLPPTSTPPVRWPHRRCPICLGKEDEQTNRHRVTVENQSKNESKEVHTRQRACAQENWAWSGTLKKKTKKRTNARTHLTDPLAPARTQLPPSRVPPPPPRLLPPSRQPQTASAAPRRAKRAPPAPPPSSPAGRAPPRGSPG